MVKKERLRMMDLNVDAFAVREAAFNP